ncbi:MAG: hypothetical protein Q4E43_01235 [Akkermansia sp.]|nr:hypothetical protein [Akkermansia sp.]
MKLACTAILLLSVLGMNTWAHPADAAPVVTIAQAAKGDKADKKPAAKDKAKADDEEEKERNVQKAAREKRKELREAGVKNIRVKSPDSWPKKVPVPENTELAEIPHKEGDKEYTYESNNYVFHSSVPISPESRKTIGRLFECAFAANKAIAKVLPVERAKQDRSQKKYKVTLCRTRREYLSKGGSQGSDGMFILQAPAGGGMVPGNIPGVPAAPGADDGGNPVIQVPADMDPEEYLKKIGVTKDENGNPVIRIPADKVPDFLKPDNNTPQPAPQPVPQTRQSPYIPMARAGSDATADPEPLDERQIYDDYVLVPFDALGMDENGKIVKNDINTHTLVHELTHQNFALNRLHTWASEGWAEYVGYVPYVGEDLDFDRCFAVILREAQKYSEDGQLRFSFTLEQFLRMPQQEMYDCMGRGQNSYLLATMLVTFFVHQDGNRGVEAMRAYMQALRDGKPKDEAVDTLIAPYKSSENLQKAFLKAWSQRKITGLSLREPAKKKGKKK